MTDAAFVPTSAAPASSGVRSAALSSATSRMLLLAVVATAIVWSFSSGNSEAAISAGSDLTRLLRFMAVLKAALAALALAMLFWRLAAPVSAARFAAYAIASGVMAAGPGLIWRMDHVALGALLLHGGLACLIVLLWRDHATVDRLKAHLARRASR